jgi:hypothetical protein
MTGGTRQQKVFMAKNVFKNADSIMVGSTQ